MKTRTKCVANCQYSNGPNCLQCKEPMKNFQGNCTSLCPNGTFTDKDNFCKPCESHCSKCNGPLNGNCTECVTSLFLSNGKCDNRCPDNLAGDENRRCKPCGTDCALCKDLKTCSKCLPDSFLKDGQCGSCGNKYFKSFNPNVCKPCQNGCLICESSDKCSKCGDGFFLKGMNCVPNCGRESFGDINLNICKPCPKNCAVCKDSTTCTDCTTGFNNHKQVCVSNCPISTISVNGACIPCSDKNCDVCSANNVAECKTCNNATFKKSSQCVTTCGKEFYANEKKECQPCSKDCSVCSKEKCLLCNNNQFVLRDTICTKECPDGYIPSGTVCIKCNEPTNCKQCRNNNLDICTKCYNKKFLLNGKCLENCPTSYYAKDDQCLLCIKGCGVCQNNSNCQVCNKGFFMQNFICVEKCDKGFVAIGDNICRPCKVGGCKECQKIDICDKCSDNKFLYNNQCIAKCELGTFPLPSMTCDTCMLDCIECHDKYTCKRCKPGKVLQETSCFSVCKDGFVPINSVCVRCKNTNCKKCLNTDLTKCIECSIEKFLYNSDCLKECPNATYVSNGSCQECKKPCNRCKDDIKCIDCIPKFNLNGIICTDNCPSKTVSINQKCHNCLDKNCLKCKDIVANACIQCDKGFILFSSTCVIVCPDNYFNQDGVCTPCIANCKKCKDRTTCEQCTGSMSIKEKTQCVSDCGISFVSVSNVCRKCNPSCLTCDVKNVNNCLTCPPKFYLYISECRANCPENTYETIKMTCENCPISNCRTCKGGMTCTNCMNNYLLENNKCIAPPCSDGWVIKDKSQECIKCEVSKCKSCSNQNTKTCDQCIANFFLIQDNKCEKECIIGTFKNSVSRKCQNCTKNCLGCVDDRHCSLCENNFYLHENLCLSSCPLGYSKTEGKCLPCAIKDCETCPINKECQKCKSLLVLQDQKCKPSCDVGYYQNKGLCQKCSIFCNQCRDDKNCILCQSPKVLSAENNCVDSCPSGSVEIKGKCTKCQSDPNCDKCDLNDLKKCLSCRNNLALKSNTCVTECGDYHYIETRKCFPCRELCKKCVNSNKCNECAQGYALYNEVCLTNCPTGTRKDNGKCLPCSQDCQICNDKTCIQCIKPTLLQEGKCLKTCSSGFFIFNQINCKPCDKSCSECFSEKSCKKCLQGFKLKDDGSCVKDCGLGFAEVSGKCKKCGENCDKCDSTNVKECTVCKNGKFLLNGLCYEKCPVGFYVKNNKCLNCLKGCDICEDDKLCKKCTPPLYLSQDQKSCDSNCKVGFRPSAGNCTPCEDKNCQKCDFSTKICEICNTPMLISGGVCVNSCPNGQYRASSGNKCGICDVTCTKCFDIYNKCIECALGFVLQDTSCVNSCNAGNVNVNSKCKKCETKDCNVCKTDLKTCEKCNQGKLLHKVNNTTVCIDKCPTGFFNNKNICVPCSENCDVCGNTSQCAKCNSGYVLQSGICQKRCNKFYVESNSECKKCHDQKCVICDSLTLKICKACDSNYILKNNECVTQCGSSFFKFTVSPDNHRCDPCTFKCDVCSNSESCIKCLTGTYLKENKCVIDCGAGWVIKDKSKCIQCTSKSCLVCDYNNPDKCITCSTDTYLKNGLCVKICGDRYFSSDKGICMPCTDPSCLRCSPQNNICQLCDSGKVLLNGECKNSCPSGWIANANFVCKECQDIKCHKCEINNLGKCIECKSGFLLLNDLTCNEKCPENYYNYENKKCLKCASNCQICDSETNCKVCKGKLFLDQTNNCTDECKPGFVEVKGKCLKCSGENCLKCKSTDTSQCETCECGFLYQGKCIEKCPDFTYSSGTRCIDCEKNCKVCTSNTECSGCKSPFLLFKKTCLSQCPEGYHESPKKGECVACPNFEKTKICDKEIPLRVIECRNGYYLDKVCVEKCSNGTFANNKKVCVSCGEDCVKCESEKSCKKCGNTLLYKGNCVKICPPKTQEINGECFDCENAHCKYCQISNLKNCRECNPNLFLLNGDCLTDCPIGYFKKGTNCMQCDAKCSDCIDEKNCKRCLNQYVLHDKNCVSTCPNGFVQRNDKCFACTDKRCNVCTTNDLNMCLSCKDSFLLNGLCVDKCPETFRDDASTKKCEPCSKYCDKCIIKGCTSCTKGYYFSQSDPTFCMPCTDPIMVIVGNRCEKCIAQGCKKCDQGKTNSCVLCDSTRFLVDGQCLIKCPNGTYPINQSCMKCNNGCKICANDKLCEECTKPNLLWNRSCVVNCPAGWISNSDGTQCIQCAQQECIECDPKKVGECKKCSKPNLLYKNQCYKICPIGTYQESTNCILCPNGCLKCNKNQCEGCNNGLKLKGENCVKECGTGYFDSTSRCDKCLDSNCEICSPTNQCQKCNKITYLIESTSRCEIKCPKGYFENTTNRTCVKCDSGCSICKGSKQCNNCEKGLVLHKGECLHNCPDGYSPSSNECVPCSTQLCKRCPVMATKCQECTKGFLYEEVCMESCPNNTFLDKTKNRCIDCNQRCESCQDKTTCTKCKSEFNLKDGKCLDKCFDGKVEIKGKCIPCNEKNCKVCLSDTNICIECKNNFLLYDNSCRIECPSGLYGGADKECKKCIVGCGECKDDQTCKKCITGFFLFKNKCVRECPKGMYGDCKDVKNNICYNCSEACEDCVDGTASNCPKCAKDYFMNDNVCVKKTGCKKGTYGNNETRSCIPCRIPFCSECDVNKCKSCNRGFEFDKNGDCIESKTFINIISQSPILFSSKTSKLFKNDEIKSFAQDIKGIGIDSENLIFTFWFRRTTDTILPTIIFNTESKKIAMNTKLEIFIKGTQEMCRLVLLQDSNINVINLGDCSFKQFYSWTFFSVTLSRYGVNANASVTIIDNKGDEKFAELNFPMLNTISFANKDSNLIFNNNFEKDKIIPSSAFEIANFNILDYDATAQDIKEFYKVKPINCDYTCTDCKGICFQCPGNIKPNTEGYCPASFVSLRRDFQRIQGLMTVDLRTKITKRLDSERFSFFIWFNSENDFRISSDIAKIIYDYPLIQNLISFSMVNSKVILKVVNEEFNPFEKITLNKGEWYFLGASIISQSVRITLRNTTSLNETKLLNLKNLTDRINEDVIFTSGIQNDTRQSFNGSYYDMRLYPNNNPSEDQIYEHYQGLPCPNHCAECSSMLTCVRCNTGYIVLDNNCVVENLSEPFILLEKSSFFNNETLSIPLPGTFNNETYLINFFYRKKLHSPPTPIINVLSIETVNGTIYPLVQEKKGINSTSNFTIVGGAGFTHDFFNEIFSFIHFAIQVNIVKKTLIFNIYDGKEYTIERTINSQIKRFILGDAKQNELNFEIGFLFIYIGSYSKPEILKLRSQPPKDCDPGCLDCDYFTGICNTCGVPNNVNTLVCNNVLNGWSHAESYDNNFNKTKTKEYDNSISQMFKRDVNSPEYSIIGFFKLFDKRVINKTKDGKFQVFRLKNRNDDVECRSANIISMDIVSNAGNASYFFTYYDGDDVKSSLIKNLEVKEETWLQIYVTIGVLEKTIYYIIRPLNNANVISDKIKLNYYPEKLTEHATLSLLGFGLDYEKKNYNFNLLNAYFYKFYLGVNLKFNLQLFEKIKNSWIVPQPECGTECEKCIFNDNDDVWCLKCINGFELENYKCIKQNIKEIALADQSQYIFLPPKSDIFMPSDVQLYSKNTITFYFRRNYNPKTMFSVIPIFKGGNVYINLNTGLKGDASLIIGVEKQPSTLLFNIDEDLNQDYNWYLIIIQYSVDTLNILIKSTSNNIQKTINLESGININIPTISFNTMGHQISIYAPNVIIKGFYDTSFIIPSTFCEIECDVCSENKCLECNWGFNSNHKCIKEPISIPAFMVGKGTKYSNSYTLATYLNNPKPLRSSTWSILFTMELTKATFEDYALNGGTTLFSLYNGSDKENSNNLFNLKFNKNNSFFLTISNRYYNSKSGSAIGFATNSFRTNPLNNLYTIGISFNDEKKEVFFTAFNSDVNYIKQTIPYEGRSENLNLDATLNFAPTFSNSTDSITFFNVHFYFDSESSEDKIQSFFESRQSNYQKSCISNTQNSCNKCSIGFKNFGPLCSPNNNTYPTILNQIIDVNSIGNSEILPYKYYNNNSTLFTISFWFKLFTFTNDPFGIIKFDLVNGKTITQLLKIHVDRNHLYVDFFDETNNQVNGLKYEELYSNTDGSSWKYFSISVDIASNIISLYSFNSMLKTNRILSNKGKVNPKLVFNSEKYATAKIGFVTNSKDIGYQFELTSLIFTSGWIPQDSIQLEMYRIKTPRKCTYRCLKNCDKNNLCPFDAYLKNDIIITESKIAKIELDPASLQQLKMYRPINHLVPINEGNPIWTDVLFSMEIDMKALLSSTYKVNSKMIINVHNSKLANYRNLTMNDIIPNENVQFGLLSVTLNDGFTFFIGSSHITNLVSSYDLGLDDIKALTKVTLNIYVDSRRRRARITVYLDDLKTFFEIKSVYPLELFSLDTLVYTHPAVSTMRINVENPRLIYEYTNYYLGKSQDLTTYPSKKCKVNNCIKCSFVFTSNFLICDRCESGFYLVNNLCMKNN